MATIMNDAAYMGFPLSIKRGNPAPVDTTAVWYNKTELETYAASGATAYVGQILTLVADNKCEAFMISNEAGTLIKLAQTTASGDLAHDVATIQSQVNNLVAKIGAPAAGDDAVLYVLAGDAGQRCGGGHRCVYLRRRGRRSAGGRGRLLWAGGRAARLSGQLRAHPRL